MSEKSENRHRPMRPTRAKAAEAAAAAEKLTTEEARLSVRISADGLHAVRLAAVSNRQSVKAYVLAALRSAGAEIPEADLREAGLLPEGKPKAPR